MGWGWRPIRSGLARRLAVIEIEGRITPLIDPEIVSSKGEEMSDEGCLSLPRLFGGVARPRRWWYGRATWRGSGLRCGARGCWRGPCATRLTI